MADNTTLPGTGDVIASDDIGGVKYQRTKVVWGADGTASDVSASAPLPVSNADCVQLLSTTVSATGTSSSIDTLGYGAVVIQLSGVWQGNCYVEASNDGTNWDTVLVFSRDNLSLQDIITQGGLYTIRPSGRYLHIVTTNITGTMAVNAIGRAAEGISAADLLSLAMDRSNNAPMFTSLDDVTVSKLSPIQPWAQLASFLTAAVVPINTTLALVDCLNYRSLSMQYTVGTTGVLTPQWSNDGATWTTASMWDQTGAIGTTIAAGSGLKVVNVVARYFRLVMTTATTAVNSKVNLYGSVQTLVPPLTSQAVTVSSGTVTTVSTVASVTAVAAINAAATTNSTTVGTLVSAATNNLTQIKASLGRLYMLDATNTTATVQYIKLFALPSASVTMGTTSATLNLAIPVAASGGRLTLNINDLGLCIGGTGISFAITTGSGLTDNTATTAGAVVLNYAYA